MNKTDNIKILVDYINKTGVFWLEDLRRLLGQEDAERTPENTLIQGLIKELGSKGFIQCSEVSKGRRQYMTINQDINPDQLVLGRNLKVNDNFSNFIKLFIEKIKEDKLINVPFVNKGRIQKLRDELDKSGLSYEVEAQLRKNAYFKTKDEVYGYIFKLQ